MSVDPYSIWSDLQTIKLTSPLIHNITNYVVMEQTANALLALGASPVMAHAIEEVSDMVSLSQSLVVNTGTLSSPWILSMVEGLKTAHSMNIPSVLDPVGSGATSFRTHTMRSLLNDKTLTVIRGNASEILSLIEDRYVTKGVDTTLSSLDHLHHTSQIAHTLQCTLWMSGAVDVISDGIKTLLVSNGHFMMSKVTGMGCTASAITGAFLAVNPDPFMACSHAALVMGITGEIAARHCQGPGTFKIAFLDTLYTLSLQDIQNRIQASFV